MFTERVFGSLLVEGQAYLPRRLVSPSSSTKLSRTSSDQLHLFNSHPLDQFLSIFSLEDVTLQTAN